MSLTANLVLMLLAGGQVAFGVERTLTLDPDDFPKGWKAAGRIVLCLSTVEAFANDEPCEKEVPVTVGEMTREYSFGLGLLCGAASSVSKDSVTAAWVVSSVELPRRALYRIDCEKRLAVKTDSFTGVPRLWKGGRTSTEQTTPLVPLDLGSKLARRLEELARGQAQIRRDVDRLQQQLDGLGSQSACSRFESESLGQREVVIAVAGSFLRFVEIEPTQPVSVGLSQSEASRLYHQAQEQSVHPLMPWIFRSVPKVERKLDSFLLQDRVIRSTMFQELGAKGLYNAVSYGSALELLRSLNLRCRNVAQFDLPTEEQFVAAAKKIYQPSVEGLQPCATLLDRGAQLHLYQLLGHTWQLTRSLCVPFRSDIEADCPEGSYIRKGGAMESDNPLECIPEYRGVASHDTPNYNTSLRLVLTH